MSERRILDFDGPLSPDDITVGQVVILHGQPRTIREVRPVEALPSRLPMLTPQVIADVGQGLSQVFYVLTCHTCLTVRAFPGYQHTSEWYGIAHDNEYRVYCSSECVTKGMT